MPTRSDRSLSPPVVGDDVYVLLHEAQVKLSGAISEDERTAIHDALTETGELDIQTDRDQWTLDSNDTMWIAEKYINNLKAQITELKDKNRELRDLVRGFKAKMRMIEGTFRSGLLFAREKMRVERAEDVEEAE